MGKQDTGGSCNKGPGAHGTEGRKGVSEKYVKVGVVNSPNGVDRSNRNRGARGK